MLLGLTSLFQPYFDRDKDPHPYHWNKWSTGLFPCFEGMRWEGQLAAILTSCIWAQRREEEEERTRTSKGVLEMFWYFSALIIWV